MDLEILRRGFSVLSSDGDVVWMRNPIPFLQKVQVLAVNLCMVVSSTRTSASKALFVNGCSFPRQIFSTHLTSRHQRLRARSWSIGRNQVGPPMQASSSSVEVLSLS